MTDVDDDVSAAAPPPPPPLPLWDLRLPVGVLEEIVAADLLAFPPKWRTSRSPLWLESTPEDEIDSGWQQHSRSKSPESSRHDVCRTHSSGCPTPLPPKEELVALLTLKTWPQPPLTLLTEETPPQPTEPLMLEQLGVVLVVVVGWRVWLFVGLVLMPTM